LFWLFKNPWKNQCLPAIFIEGYLTSSLFLRPTVIY
jgi:hypothetical protein